MAFQAEIVGLGKSGEGAARLLTRAGWQAIIRDRADNGNLQQQKARLAAEGIQVELASQLDLSAGKPDLLVVSPGVPWDVPILQAARSAGVETLGELELAWRFLSASPWVGITGTNGKTTTTALTGAIFAAAGDRSRVCGNIGTAACELALEALSTQGIGNKSFQLPPYFDWIIAEISSYQCESSHTLAPKIGVWTTFTPDHLERHKTLENYFDIKASLLERSKQQVVNLADEKLRLLAPEGRFPLAYWVSTKQEHLPELERSVYIDDAWVRAFGELIMPIHLFKMPGDHNLQNLLLAIAVARLAGIEKSAIADGIAGFKGVAHRLEWIREFSGAKFINDSKATNYEAAVVGLGSVESPAILIAGGKSKSGNDQEWLSMIQAQAAKVLLIGDASAEFANKLQQIGYEDYEEVETMERAISRSVELLKSLSAATVLLSPACASFDQYPNFEARGDHFRILVNNL
ncbi:MAG: UDP-N-acetylmuramoyl-L-alanine--D-glutamate ligase [Cyanobacteria bacterium P01_H01_bin.15]